MNKFLVNLALIVASLSFASCATPVAPCASGVQLPALTQVNDCEQMPCPLVRGTTVVLNITFVAQDYIEALTPEVIAFALGAEVNYPLSETNGCNSLLTLSCPLNAGDVVNYKLEMPIYAIYPTIPLDLQFTLYNQDRNGLVCFLLNAVVVAS